MELNNNFTGFTFGIFRRPNEPIKEPLKGSPAHFLKRYLEKPAKKRWGVCIQTAGKSPGEREKGLIQPAEYTDCPADSDPDTSVSSKQVEGSEDGIGEIVYTGENYTIPGDYGVPQELGKTQVYSAEVYPSRFPSEWIQSNIIAECFRDAQKHRCPPCHGWYEYQPQDENQYRNLVSILSQLEPREDVLRFAVQVLRENGDKSFEKSSPTNYSATDLLKGAAGDVVFKQVCSDPTKMLSMMLKLPSHGEPNIVVVDMDPQKSCPTSINPLEQPFLEGLPDLVAMESRNGPNSHPIVIQSPRGLHLIFKVPPDIKPKLSRQRDKLSRVGIQLEYITSGNCVLIGQNYRLVSHTTGINDVSYLPFGLWPLSAKLVEPMILEGPVPKGYRYNTLQKGVEKGQLVFLNHAPLVTWLTEYLFEKDDKGEGLSKKVVEYWRGVAKSRYAKTSGKELGLTGGNSNPYAGFDLVIPAGGEGDDGMRGFASRFKMAAQLAQTYFEIGGKAPLHQRQAVQHLIQSGEFKNLAQHLCLSAFATIYMSSYGIVIGSAFAIREWISGLQRYVILDLQTQELLFYNKKKLVWEVMEDEVFRQIVSSLLSNFQQPELESRRVLDEVINEIRDRIGVHDWGEAVSGFAYKNGVMLLGWPSDQLLSGDPELQLKTAINADYDSSAEFFPDTESYFKNLAAYNPATLHLLRLELFSVLFQLGTPSHFLYMQGPPGTGKSLLFQYVEHFLGKESVYRSSMVGFDGQFAFAGTGSRLKYVVFEDCDMSAATPRLLSFIKEKCTQPYMRIKRKYANKEVSAKNVHYAICTNMMLPSKEVAEALERRQIILQTKPIPNRAQKTDLLEILKANTAAIQRWLNNTPHLLHVLKKYSSVINYFTESTDFSFSTVSQFLMAHLDRFFIVEDFSHPINSLTAEQGGDYGAVTGLHAHYVNYCVNSGLSDTDIVGHFQFSSSLTEFAKSVFCTEMEPKSSSYIFNHRIPGCGTQSTDRSSWYHIRFAEDETVQQKLTDKGYPTLTPKMPLAIAALALLHPTVEDPVNSLEGYSPGIAIHFKQPIEMLRGLYDLVQQGPEREVELSVKRYKKQVSELLDSIKRREQLADKQAAQLGFEPDPTGNNPLELVQGDLTVKSVSDSLEGTHRVDDDDAAPHTLQKLDFEVIQNTYKLSGALDSADDPRNYSKKLPEKATFKEVYELFLAHQDERNRTDSDIIETNLRESAPLDTFISKKAFLKLSSLWLKNANFNQPRLMNIKLKDTWEEVLAKHDLIVADYPVLVWDKSKTLVVDVDFPQNGGEVQAPVPSVAEVQAPVPSVAEAQATVSPVAVELTPEFPVAKKESTNTSLSQFDYKREQDEVMSSLPVLVPANSATNGGSAPLLESNGGKVQNEVVSKYAPRPVPVNNSPKSRVPVGNKPKKGRSPKQEIKYLDAIKNKSVVQELLASYNVKELVWNAETRLLILQVGSIFKGLKISHSDFYAEVFSFLGTFFEGKEKDAFQTKSLLIAFLKSKEAEGVPLHQLTKKACETILGKILHKEVCPNIVEDSLFLPRSGPEEEYFNSLHSYDWGIKGLTGEDWKKPFLKAAENEKQRAKFAQWTDYCKAPHVLNKHIGPVVYSAAFICGFFSNVLDLLHDRRRICEKTGNWILTFHWKRFNCDHPFAEIYTGSAEMRDVGRLAVSGTCFNTYYKPFRDTVFPLILSTLKEANGFQFFILDLKGCHAALQASLLKTEILYRVYSTPGGDLWSEFVKLSANGPPLLKMTMADKPLLKIAFYASLNGAKIDTAPQIVYQLNKVHKKGSPLYSRLESFSQAMIAHPITKELVDVGLYWKSLKGKMYAPTRKAQVVRTLTAEQATKKNEEKALKAGLGGYTNNPSWMAHEGDPIDRQLPTCYYTSLECIMASRIMGLVFSYIEKTNREGLQRRKTPFGVVQGIHDGIMFVTSKEVCLQSLTDHVNKDLGEFTKAALGLSLEVTPTPCDGHEWTKALNDHESAEIPENQYESA